MNHATLLEIIKAFADDTESVVFERGRMVAQVHDRLIEVEVFNKEGSLWIRDDIDVLRAEHWITHKLARLPMLAERILLQLPPERYFVAPKSTIVDQLEFSGERDVQITKDTICSITDILGRRPAGTTSVIYLTSDAGEGKTTLINYVARQQAEKYRNKQTDWLLLPVPLAGRPFLRFDDVVIGTLVNQFRFSLLYYQAFYALVQLGVLIPALDGFEEFFVEGAKDEGVSALGSIIKSLKGNGTLLVAARKAFFEYKSIHMQSRLLESIGRGSASFAKLALDRWDRDHFISYCIMRGIKGPDSLYSDIAAKLGHDHPLLTRAVLVSRLAEIANDLGSRQSFLDKLSGPEEEYFSNFVRVIIEREAREKWINIEVEIKTPLLSIEEHCDLLSLLAQEMWLNKTDALRKDILDVVAEMFADQYGKSLSVRRQIVDRLPHHSLIGRQSTGFAFDHEEFKLYFLGYGLGHLVAKNKLFEVVELLRVAPLQPLSANVAVYYIRKNCRDILSTLINNLQQACRVDGLASYTRQNAGYLSVELAHDIHEPITFKELSFPINSLMGHKLAQATFVGCEFQATSLKGTELDSCAFLGCRFEKIELADQLIAQVNIGSDTEIACVETANGRSWFDPVQVLAQLKAVGFEVMKSVPKASAELDIVEEVVMAQRALGLFSRNTEVSEAIFQRKLGKKYNNFTSTILPALLKAEVLTGYDGVRNQRLYRLNVTLEKINRALEEFGYSFALFIRELSPARDSDG